MVLALRSTGWSASIALLLPKKGANDRKHPEYKCTVNILDLLICTDSAICQNSSA
jgi:hypothetical protein